MANSDIAEKIAPLDHEIAEQWVRKTSEPDLRGVEAHRLHDGGAWPWRVSIWAAEFVREEPLEQARRDGMRAALEAVRGVTRVEEEGREVWVIAGSPDGEEMIKAAAKVVDQLAERVREHIRQLS